MTKQQLREAIRHLIKKELKEALFMSPTQVAYVTGYKDGKAGKSMNMDYDNTSMNEVNRFSARKAFEKDIQSDKDYIDLKKKASMGSDGPDEVPHASKKDHYINDRFKDIENPNLEDDDLKENQPKPATTPNPSGPATLPTTKPKIKPTAPGKPIRKPGHVPDDEPAKARSLKKENEDTRKKIIDRLKNKR